MDDRTGFPLFPNSPADSRWDSSLIRRARVLLHTFPLHTLRIGDSRVDEDRRHYDSLLLALKVMDLIVENAGLETEVDRTTVNRALVPLLTKMDEAAGLAPDGERHRLAIDRVLGGLRNDDDRRRPFSILYQDFDDSGRVVTRQLDFFLAFDQFHASGGTVLRLSNAAINLYLNALELDIEDAQTAAEAVLQSQLARGRFDEAVQSARNAKLQSIRYDEKIAGILRDTRRDLRRVDWKNEVPQTISDALDHIRRRTEMENSILSAAEERLEALSDPESVRKVYQVVQLIRDCRVRHMDLHNLLMGARNVFLEEQGRQSFLSKPAVSMPSLETEVLEPVLRMGRSQALEVADIAFPLWFGARAGRLFSLADTLIWQLRPRREPAAGDLAVEEDDLAVASSEIPRFSPELREMAKSVCAELGSPVRLSELLAVPARPPGLAHLLVLLALHDYAREQGEPTLGRVEKIEGERLDAAGFHGDELMIYPDGADADAA
jgi:hypothetical protein